VPVEAALPPDGSLLHDARIGKDGGFERVLAGLKVPAKELGGAPCKADEGTDRGDDGEALVVDAPLAPFGKGGKKELCDGVLCVLSAIAKGAVECARLCETEGEHEGALRCWCAVDPGKRTESHRRFGAVPPKAGGAAHLVRRLVGGAEEAHAARELRGLVEAQARRVRVQGTEIGPSGGARATHAQGPCADGRFP